MNMNTTPLEAETRVLIDRSLENLGWKLKGKDKNVFFEQPKTELERKKLGGKRPDYVLYSKESEKPLIVIEAKKKGSRIDEALEQGIGYARAIDAPLVFATDGVFCKAFHTGANRPPILNGEEVDEFIREALALRYLTSYEVNTVSPKVQYDRKELIRIFDEANNMLRGEGLRAGIERFGEFANILFLKLISESEQAKKERGEPTKFDMACSWDAIKGIPASTRIEYINKTVYDKLNALYETDIFTPLQIKDTGILKDIMDKLDPLMLTDVDSDVKGDAFEYFLKASTSTKNDLGEYFTPRHIVKTMVRLVNPQIGEKIYDPFCGTGGFLIESFRYIYNNMARTDANLALLRENTVYGNEITNTARITKMNMILAGDGHSNIEMKDSLANPVDGTETYMDESGKIHHRGFDIVLANMPYSQKTKYGSLYDLPSTNGDSICVQHCMKAINSAAPNGRMALVVPEGFLFRKDLTKTREYLLDHCQLQSIISLPQGVFLPYTGVKTDIIYATKVNQKVKSSEKKKTFWYFDVKSDGYTLDNHRRKLDSPSDLSKYEEYRKLDEDQANDMLKVGFEVIPLSKVRQNSSILVGSRYRTQTEKNTKYPLISLSDENYFQICSGGTPSSTVPEYWNGDINWITLADLPADDFVTEIRTTQRTISEQGLNNSNAKLLPKNTVVVSTRATIGRVGIARTELATNQGFKNIIVRRPDEILPEYVAYILTSQTDFMMRLASGATFKEISKENFCTIQIPLLPIEQQRQLVLDIAGYRKVIAGAQAIVNGYHPHLPCLADVATKTLDEIATFRPAKDEIKNLPSDTDVSFVPMASLNTFDASFEATETRKLGDVSSGFTYFKNNDILLAKITPCFENGKAGIAHNLKNGIGFGSTEYIVIRADESVVYPEWIFYYINTREFIDGGKPFMTGTAGQQRIDINYVKQYQIPVPSLEEQKILLDEIHREQALIKPSKQIIDVFTAKIDTRIKEIWGE
jgi:type I restriction enzyme M protein|nr:N-6 DNA methylase [uncultured Oscillibacter sp.]